MKDSCTTFHLNKKESVLETTSNLEIKSPQHGNFIKASSKKVIGREYRLGKGMANQTQAYQTQNHVSQKIESTAFKKL